MKKKKIVSVCIVLVFAIVGVYFCYKISLVDKYSSKHVDKALEFKDEWVIKYKSKEDIEYLSVEDLKIENVFGDFKKLSSNERTPQEYEKVLEDGKKARVNFIKYVSYVDGLSKDVSVISGNIDADMIYDFMKEHDFKDDVEFFKYLNDYEEKKINIFTSIKDIKENYTVEFLRDSVLTDADFHNLKFIYKEGSRDEGLSGYVLQEGDYTDVNIIKDDKMYIVSFGNKDYFDEETIKDLLSTVEIN